MENIKYVVFGGLFVSVIALTVFWSGKHDEQVALAADNYETCIKEQTHMTPQAYYEANGEFPECLK